MTQSDANTSKRHFMGVAWLFGGGGTAPSDSAHSPQGDDATAAARAALYTGHALHRGGGGGTSPGPASPQRGLEASREDFDVMHGSASLWESTGYQDLKVSIDEACLDRLGVVSKTGLAVPKSAALTRSHEEFTIVVKTHTQKRVEVVVCQALTVLELKQEIAKHAHVPVERQKLLAHGQRLEDDRLLGAYNITASTVVHLVMALT